MPRLAGLHLLVFGLVVCLISLYLSESCLVFYVVASLVALIVFILSSAADVPRPAGGVELFKIGIILIVIV